MMRRIFYVFILMIIFFLSIQSIAGEIKNQDDADTIAFLALADIHFDPFFSCAKKIPCPLIQQLRQASSTEWSSIFERYDTSKPLYRRDTNYTLLKSVLSATKKISEKQNIQFVLILGDFLGHDYRDEYRKYSNDDSAEGYQAFVRKTFAFLTDELAANFKTIDVYMVVGNNDSYQGDYVSNPQGIFFKETATRWSTLIKNKMNRETMRKQFANAGYYAVELSKKDHLQLIVLNSNLFSRKERGRHISKGVNDEMQWFHQTLMSMKEKKQKAVIVMHIPESIDVYATHRFRLFTLFELWKSEYIKRFEKELNQFAESIVGILTAHLHSDWSQMQILENGDEIPLSGVPAVSPIFGNQPGFKIYNYSLKNQRLNAGMTYVLALKK